MSPLLNVDHFPDFPSVPIIVIYYDDVCMANASEGRAVTKPTYLFLVLKVYISQVGGGGWYRDS
jgi:hypothetical protein